MKGFALGEDVVGVGVIAVVAVDETEQGVQVDHYLLYSSFFFFAGMGYWLGAGQRV